MPVGQTRSSWWKRMKTETIRKNISLKAVEPNQVIIHEMKLLVRIREGDILIEYWIRHYFVLLQHYHCMLAFLSWSLTWCSWKSVGVNKKQQHRNTLSLLSFRIFLYPIVLYIHVELLTSLCQMIILRHLGVYLDYVINPWFLIVKKLLPWFDRP